MDSLLLPLLLVATVVSFLATVNVSNITNGYVFFLIYIFCQFFFFFKFCAHYAATQLNAVKNTLQPYQRLGGQGSNLNRFEHGRN